MNVVDSSGWLEYLSGSPNADQFKPLIKDEINLIIPTLCLYEVFKIILARAGEEQALRAAGQMSFGTIVDLDRDIALAAGQISLKHKLAMADSIIYATALAHNANLWTQDEHFKGLPGVRFIRKKSS
jgi:predicted nucleic acid-binding protein